MNMMKLISIIFFASLFLNCASTTRGNDASKKEFEGIILYKVIAESKTKNISTANLQKLYGDTMVMFIKSGKYKMSYSGLRVKDILYLSETNNEYTIFHNIDTLYVSSCANDPRPLTSFKESDEEEWILNRKCKKIVTIVGTDEDDTWGSVQNSYWYDPEIYLDPAPYMNRKISHVHLYYEAAKSPWLKYKFEGTSFNLSYTAISLEVKTLKKSLFELPDFPSKIYP